MALMVIATGAAFAQEDATVTQNQVDAQSAESTPTAAERLDMFQRDFLKEKNMSAFGDQADGSRFFYGGSRVSRQENDPQFWNAVRLAYVSAILQIYGEAAKGLFGTMSLGLSLEQYFDESENAKKLGEAQYNTTESTKVSATKDELTVSRSVSQVPVNQKKINTRNNISQDHIKQAIGMLRGIAVMRTCIAKDSEGNAQVGVIAKLNPQLIGIAKSVEAGIRPVIQGKGKNLNLMLPKSDREWLNTIGARVLYDEDGTPCVLSFGMASYKQDKSNSFANGLRRDNARNKAMADAENYISMYANLAVDTTFLNNLALNFESAVEGIDDINKVEKTIDEIIDKTYNNVHGKSNLKLTGVEFLNGRYVKLDNGQEVYVAAQKWSYGREARSQRIVEEMNKPISRSSVPNSPDAGKGAVKWDVLESSDFDSDF